MFNGNLDPVSASEVVVVLGYIPIGPIRLNELSPSFEMAIKLRARKSVDAIGRFAPPADGLTNRTEVLWR